MKIFVENLHFSYGKEKILNNTTLQVHKGELVSIVGPNGTGKSTFVKCINGLLKTKTGNIEIDRIDIKRMDRKQIAKRVSYVPQSSRIIFNLSVFDMVLFGRRPHNTFQTSREDKIKVLKALRILKIEHLAMKNYNHLSGGQQQKVIIARALAQESGIILLDEPISNLDIRHQLEVMDTIRTIVDEAAVSVVMVVHDLNIASQYSDRVVMMNNGEIFADGLTEEVLTKKNIAAIYGVDVNLVHHDEKTYIIPLKVQKK